MGKKYEPVEICEREINGQPVTYLRHSSGKPGVAILVSDGSKLLLLRCHRPLIGDEPRWEIPRGFSDSREPRDAALAELMEETGLTPTSMESLGELHADSGVLESSTLLFLASVSPESPVTVGHECIIGASWVNFEQIRKMIGLGEITDSFTLAALVKMLMQSHVAALEPERDLDDFFLREAADNLRHTDSKTIQIAGGVAAATAAMIAVGFRGLSDDPLAWSTARYASLVAVAMWSSAATTKMLRYRSWREHYLRSLQQMVGDRYRDDAPKIFQTYQDVEPFGLDRLKKRFLGDESFVGLSAIVALVSSALSTLLVVNRMASGANLGSTVEMIIISLSMSLPLFSAFWIARATKFRVQ